MSSYEPSLPQDDLRGKATQPAVRRPSRWAIDRRVPIVTILSLMVQILMAGLWFGRTQARLDRLDAWVHENEATDRRLAVIETRLDTVHSSLERIERRLLVAEPR